MALLIPDVSGNGMGAQLSQRKSSAITQLRYWNDVGLVEGRGSLARSMNNSAALNFAAKQAALDGVNLAPRPGAQYYFAGQITLPAYSRIVQENGTMADCVMDARWYTNTSQDLVDRYSDRACLFNITGSVINQPLPGIHFGGFVVRPESGQGFNLRPIRMRYLNQPTLYPVQCIGMGLGVFITLGSLQNGAEIYEPYMYSCYENSTIFDAGKAPQMSFIEIDADPYMSLLSEAIRIENPRWRDLVFGPDAMTAYGDQTDGINIAKSGTHGTQIINAKGRNVGEQIDNFGEYTSIQGGVFENSRLFGLKFIYGSKGASVTSPTINNFGLAGVVINGFNSNSTPVVPTRFVSVVNPQIAGGDYEGQFVGNSTACMLLQGSNLTVDKRATDCVVQGGVLQEGNAKHCWLDNSGGLRNVGEGVNCITGPNNNRAILNTALVGQTPTNEALAAGGVRPKGKNQYYYDAVTV